MHFQFISGGCFTIMPTNTMATTSGAVSTRVAYGRPWTSCSAWPECGGTFQFSHVEDVAQEHCNCKFAKQRNFGAVIVVDKEIRLSRHAQLNSLPTMALRATGWASLPTTVWNLDSTTRWSRRSFCGLPHPPRATCRKNTARPSFMQFRHLSRSLLTLSPHTLSPPTHPHTHVLHPPTSTHTLIATVLVFCAIETWCPIACLF